MISRNHNPSKELMMDASTMTTQISKLRTMGLQELQEKYHEVFGKETKSRNRTQLFSQIARKMQDGAEPESANKPVALPTLVAKFEKQGRSKNKSKTAKREKATEGKKPRTRVKPLGERDPRLPKAGTVLTREWHGKKYLVKVLEQGFEYGGKPYRSLSGVAKAISGQIVNGYAWFSLQAGE